jgi:hypothetical protein
MRRTLTIVWTGTRWCMGCVWSFALWSAWLALAIMLCVLGYIGTHQQLEVPGFLLRSLEERLAVSGVRATFGRTSFDPTGRVLIQDVRVSLPAFAEPVVSARAIYVRLDPWSLAAGQFEPRELRVSGASLAVPAMLSPSGRSEDILSELDATIVPHEHEMELTQLTARVAGIALVAHGAIGLPSASPAQAGSLPLADLLAHNYPAISRQLVAASQDLKALDDPSLQLELTPSATRIAIARITLFARGLKLTVPQPIQVTGLRAFTRVPLVGDAPVSARLDLTADGLMLPFEASATRIHAVVRGSLSPGRLQFFPRELDLTADAMAAAGFSAQAVVARLLPGPLPRIAADVEAVIMGAPLAVHADADLAAQTATLRFDGAISSAILTPISDRLHADIRKYFDFERMDHAAGTVRLGPGWKFENLSGRIALRGISAYHVTMEEARAVFDFDGRTFYAPEAWARIGENYARGTFEQDLPTLDYRFLLEGRLRPLDISGWFHEWWPNFFEQLKFPTAPPAASVEVSGRWRGGGKGSVVFVFADTLHPVIRDVALDRVRTRLFIRPGFYDAMEMFATHPTGAAVGTFCYINEPVSGDWRTLTLDVATTLDPSVAGRMIGPRSDSILGRFKWSAVPVLKLAGHIDGPAAPAGAHAELRVEGSAAGEFRVHDFPLEDVSFTARVHDDDVDVSRLEAKVAEGTLAGRMKIFGEGADRRVNFDFGLHDANLSRAVALLQNYTAQQKGIAPTPPGKFMQEKAAVRLDLQAAAEGRYDDKFTYHGEGHATLQGAGLGEVQLLGLLSEFFTFTKLHFNNARATFKIDGAKLTFPEVVLRGANSAIDAHGEVALERRELDFKARIYPFQESTGLIKNVVGAVLSPLSNIFEVKLNGTIDKPAWALAVTPGSLFHSGAPGETPPDPTKSPGLATPAAPPTANPVPGPAPAPGADSPGAPGGAPAPKT